MTESDLKAMGEPRVANLARSLKLVKNVDQDFLKMAERVFIEKYKEREARKQALQDDMNEGQDGGHVISKENLALRDLLTEMGIEFQEEHLLEDALFKSDFYLPK